MKCQAQQTFFVAFPKHDVANVQKWFSRVGALPVLEDMHDSSLLDDKHPIRAVVGVGQLNRPVESECRKSLHRLQRQRIRGAEHATRIDWYEGRRDPMVCSAKRTC